MNVYCVYLKNKKINFAKAYKINSVFTENNIFKLKYTENKSLMPYDSSFIFELTNRINVLFGSDSYMVLFKAEDLKRFEKME